MKFLNTLTMLLLVGITSPDVYAQNLSVEVQELRQMLTEMQQNYEQRIGDLESRLSRAERSADNAQQDAEEAIELAEQSAIDFSSGASAPNTFNPAIGAILVGQYADAGAAWNQIPGFQPAGEIGTAESGFSLGESEINLNANIDSRYFGNLTLGLGEDDGSAEFEIEEAWLQTNNLPSGLTVLAGRFFSSIGYLNNFHSHTDDFTDRPLPYQAFFGGRYSVDGLRASWIAPTPFLLELGAEANWGDSFPATQNETSSPGAWTLFAKVGGDLGNSHSWQVGLSTLNADAVDRDNGDPGNLSFTGSSDMTAFDFVWKWAPQGNTTSSSLKVQGEYFTRQENGILGALPYDVDQSGWYLQGVWQFAPLWRVGLRHDIVDSGFAVPGGNSKRDSLMLDWSPSEFSRLRFQYTNDKVLPVSDDQWYLQYIMSIGAHGAHQF